MTAVGPASRRAGWILAALIVAASVPAIGPLLGHDPSWCYPFMLPDSWDWLNNALYWSGARVEPSFRPPALPLLLAALDGLGQLPLFPVLTHAALGGTALALFSLLSRRHSTLVAFLSAWLFFANAQLQDHARYLMAELPATFLLVLAACAFERAEREPRAWIVFGLALAASGLFHHAAIPAGAGFAVAALLSRREALRERSFWIGASLAAAPLAAWLLGRAAYYRSHPGMPRHVQEELLRISAVGVRYYVFSLAALVGIVALPLLVAGSLSLLTRATHARRSYRAAYLAPLLSLSLFFVFVYGYVEKRLLVYVFPFAVCVLAEGLARLEVWSRTRSRRILAAGYVGLVLAWGNIRYPTGDPTLLALTPRDFVDWPVRFRGATLSRPNATWPGGLLGGPLDPVVRRLAPCEPSPRRMALERLAPRLDERLGPGERVGLINTGHEGVLYWIEVNRLSNTLRRPVVRPDQAAASLTEGPPPEGASVLLSEPPWTLVSSSSR